MRACVRACVGGRRAFGCVGGLDCVYMRPCVPAYFTEHIFVSEIPINLARGRPAAQRSDVTLNHLADRAIDGQAEAFFTSNSYAKTKKEGGIWWRVNFIETVVVEEVAIVGHLLSAGKS